MIGEVTRTIVVEPGPQTTITGVLPPVPKNWWPWIIAGAAALGLLYLGSRERRRPLGGGAG